MNAQKSPATVRSITGPFRWKLVFSSETVGKVAAQLSLMLPWSLFTEGLNRNRMRLRLAFARALRRVF